MLNRLWLSLCATPITLKHLYTVSHPIVHRDFSAKIQRIFCDRLVGRFCSYLLPQRVFATLFA